MYGFSALGGLSELVSRFRKHVWHYNEKRLPNSISFNFKAYADILWLIMCLRLYRVPTTSDLIRALLATKNLRRVCGFSAMGKIPSQSTFSRAFAEFAISELGTKAHNSLVQEYLADELLGHISRDSTAIVGREKSAKKVKKPHKPRKRGRPAKGEKWEPAPLKRLDRQIALSAEEAVLELPTLCDRGTKKNAKLQR